MPNTPHESHDFPASVKLNSCSLGVLSWSSHLCFSHVSKSDCQTSALTTAHTELRPHAGTVLIPHDDPRGAWRFMLFSCLAESRTASRRTRCVTRQCIFNETHPRASHSYGLLRIGDQRSCACSIQSICQVAWLALWSLHGYWSTLPRRIYGRAEASELAHQFQTLRSMPVASAPH